MSTDTAERALPAGIHVADPIHSSVGFAITHNGLSIFRSGFRSYEARLTGGESPRLEGTVDVTSVDIDDEQLRGHLLSPDFFDAERFPRLRFSSTELAVDADGSVRLRGELAIRGEKREVAATGRFASLGADIAGRQRIGLSLESSVDRRDFGLDWQMQLPGGEEALAYEVGIAVELELLKEDE